jgi:hypothetical protein
MGTFATTTSLSTKMVGTIFDSATTSLASASITDAEREIKKQLSKRYDFSAAPFLDYATVPPSLIYLTETLAIGYMYENMARGSKEGYARADRYIKRVMDNLEELKAGEAQLLDTNGEEVSEIVGDWAIHTTENYPPTFNEDDPENWKVSTSKFDDIEDSRDE